MKRKLSPWCKSVQKALIDRDMSVLDLAEAIGRSREYTSAIVNGRVFSDPAAREISDYLDIVDNAERLAGN